MIAILRGKEEAQRRMDELDREGRHGTTSVNAFELVFGAFKSAQRKSNVEKTTSLLEKLDIFPFGIESSKGAGEILADLEARGESIDFRDAMIAGIAKTNNLTVVTRNKGNFARIRSLTIETW